MTILERQKPKFKIYTNFTFLCTSNKTQIIFKSHGGVMITSVGWVLLFFNN